MINILNKIYEFCKVEENKIYRTYTDIIYSGNMSNRYLYLLNLLNSLNIQYEIDEYIDKNKIMRNIIMKGNSNKIFTAHYDIINLNSDNANDNSASVINLIAFKTLRPDANIVLLDGEEPPFMGSGSRRLSKRILKGELFNNIKWIFNLELTGKGGNKGIISDYNTELGEILKENYNVSKYDVPFNDATIFNMNGIQSEVITTLPIVDEKYNFNYLWNCHSVDDSLDTISIYDMKIFIEDILLTIINK